MMILLLLVALATSLTAQTDQGPRTQKGTLDASGGSVVLPSGTTLPESCTDAAVFIKTDATTGQQVYVCEDGEFVVQGTGIATLVQKIALPLVACEGTDGILLWDTLATGAPTPTCTAGSTNTAMIRGVADFPDEDGTYSVQLAFPLPDDWTGNVAAKFYWRAAATSGDVVWQMATACAADDELDDVAWNTASVIADTAKGTANRLNTATISNVTMTGCAAGEILHVRVVRDREHASDSISGVVSLGHVELTLRRAI